MPTLQIPTHCRCGNSSMLKKIQKIYFDAWDGIHRMNGKASECILLWLEMRMKIVFGVNRCKNKTRETIKSYFYEKRSCIVCSRCWIPLASNMARHPNRLQCSFIILESVAANLSLSIHALEPLWNAFPCAPASNTLRRYRHRRRPPPSLPT